MSAVLALPHLFDLVVARFAREGTDVPQSFGWRAPQRHTTTSARIAWVPGDPSGHAGELSSARNPGRHPRPLATLLERFTVILSAVDPDAPEDERRQYEATRLLYDAWLRAVYLAARGTFRIVSSTWDTTHNLRRRGAALVVVATVEAMIPDTPQATVPTGARARVPVHLLDAREVLAVDPPVEGGDS